MDLYKTIQILHEERERLAKLIAYLEHVKQLKTSKGESSRRKPPDRRGRKRMTAAERREVSERIKKYWAARAAPAGEEAADPSSTAASA